MRKVHNGKGRGARLEAGFTLLEVLAAVVIIGVALTVVMVDRNESVKRVALTENYRTATMLAQQKLSEVLLGLEGGTAGEFEEYGNFSWKLLDGSEDFLQGERAGSLSAVTLTVTYPAGGDEAQVTLVAHRREGKQ